MCKSETPAGRKRFSARRLIGFFSQSFRRAQASQAAAGKLKVNKRSGLKTVHMYTYCAWMSGFLMAPNRRKLPSGGSLFRVSADVSEVFDDDGKIVARQPRKPCCWCFRAWLQRASSLDGDVLPELRQSIFIETADRGFWFEHEVRRPTGGQSLKKY